MLRRVETGETYVGEIPIALFQGDEFKNRKYLKKGAQIVFDGIKNLNIPKNEQIHICSGYIFTKVRESLEEKGFNIFDKKIVGDTQKLAEKEFLKSLVRMGVGSKDKVTKMRSFNSYLRWVLNDLEQREKYVKTGWPAWPKLKGE